MVLPGLKLARLASGMTQEGLSKESGVSRDTIQKLETSVRPARATTIARLAEALGVGSDRLLSQDGKENAVEKTRTEKVEVVVSWEDENGLMRGENLRFRGEEIDSSSSNDSQFTLYECPGGYRVHVANGYDGTAYLNPSEVGVTEVEYPTYSVEELVEEFPMFGEVVGVYRVRDID